MIDRLLRGLAWLIAIAVMCTIGWFILDLVNHAIEQGG